MFNFKNQSINFILSQLTQTKEQKQIYFSPEGKTRFSERKFTNYYSMNIRKTGRKM